jgi:hypothetical protein
MSPDGENWLTVSDDGVAVVSGAGMAFAGGITAGSTNLAEPVALAAAYESLLTELLAQLATAFTTPAVVGAPLDPAWATTVVPLLQAKLALLSTAGKSQTLKASPT